MREEIGRNVTAGHQCQLSGGGWGRGGGEQPCKDQYYSCVWEFQSAKINLLGTVAVYCRGFFKLLYSQSGNVIQEAVGYSPLEYNLVVQGGMLVTEVSLLSSFSLILLM